MVAWAARVNRKYSPTGPARRWTTDGEKCRAGEADERLGQRIGVQHQAQGGGEGELEAHVPQHVRIAKRHHPGRQAQAVETILAAADLAGKQGQPAHDGGPHHGRVRTHQQGINGDRQSAQAGAQKAPALAQQSPEKGREQAGNDGDIESTDRDDVGCPRLPEGILNVRGDAGLDPQQDTGVKGGFRIGEQAVDALQGPLFEAVNECQQRVALAAHDPPGGGRRHQAVNPLAGQVIAVGKIFRFQAGSAAPPPGAGGRHSASPHPAALAPGSTRLPG